MSTVQFHYKKNVKFLSQKHINLKNCIHTSPNAPSPTCSHTSPTQQSLRSINTKDESLLADTARGPTCATSQRLGGSPGTQQALLAPDVSSATVFTWVRTVSRACGASAASPNGHTCDGIAHVLKPSQIPQGSG